MRLMLFATVFLFAACAQVRAQAPIDLVKAARARIGQTLIYDPAYVALAYPGGDVPSDRGVCTDVVIRAFRAAYGYDLQQAVHEDMAAAFSAYPAHWGLTKPDKNIDHRRVPNLEAFFSRQGAQLPLMGASDFQPGDLVTWRIGGRQPHIGIVSDETAKDGTPLIIHNIGQGTREEDVLHAYEKVGHFRFVGAEDATLSN